MQKHRVTGCYIKKRKKISFAHISTFKDFSLNKRELSNQEGLQATQIYYQGKLENHFQRHIKKLKSSMIKYPFKKIPSRINILQHFLCCNTKEINI